MFEGQILSKSVADLITVTEPWRGLSPELLEVPGGFLWWYCDMVDEQGSGLVMIWSYGLPFLPGLASAARRGEPVAPVTRPSLNIALYERGEQVCYLLQEYAQADATWEPELGEWRFGASTMRVRREAGRVVLEALLDCALPGSDERLKGQVRMDGVARVAGVGEGSQVAPHHDWTPLMGPARGRARFEHGRWRWEFAGRAYHDRNGGMAPLHELGFKWWIWGRLAFEDAELIYYVLWPTDGGEPTAIGLRIDGQGETTRWDGLRVKLRGKHRSWAGGRPWWEQIELFTADGMLWLEVVTRAVVDHGPFYLRFVLEGKTLLGEQRSKSTSVAAAGRTWSEATWSEGELRSKSTGIGEACWPDRVDLARHRPLVQMRVHQDEGESSMWSALFTGPRAGRVTRLLRSWVTR
jgi:hypothetical protein